MFSNWKIKQKVGKVSTMWSSITVKKYIPGVEKRKKKGIIPATCLTILKSVCSTTKG